MFVDVCVHDCHDWIVRIYFYVCLYICSYSYCVSVCVSVLVAGMLTYHLIALLFQAMLWRPVLDLQSNNGIAL